MKTLKPAPVSITGGLITVASEWPVWDLVLDDDDTTAVPNISSRLEPTITDTEETESNVWTVTFSDGTVVTDLAKTGSAPAIDTATEDEGEDSDIWDVTFGEGTHFRVLTSPATTPAVGGFCYFLTDKPANRPPAEETFLCMTAAEYAKWVSPGLAG